MISPYNCVRCGRDFQRFQREIVCPSCKAPDPLLTRRLSVRERQVVALVSEGKANKEIGYVLHLSEGTIKEYLNRIFHKLGMKSRTELAVWHIREQRSTSTEKIEGTRLQ